MKYDVEKAERDMRALIQHVTEEADKAVAEGRADEMFLRTQRFFNEARILFGMAPLHAANAGANQSLIAEAAGNALGHMYAGIMGGFNESDQAILFAAVDHAMAQQAMLGEDTIIVEVVSMGEA